MPVPSRVMRRLLTCATPLALALGTAAPLWAQADPSADYRTLHTEHFRVTYQPELEDAARHAAQRAEVVRAMLARTLTSAPRGTIDIVLVDDLDLTNGAATPLPSNRIYVYAKPPTDLMALAYTRDWIDLVVTHELAHIFHLDAHGKLGDAVRTVFGRVPFTWPVFPALGTPLWSLEGLAVQVESALSGFGRIHGTWHEAVVRTAVLAGRPDPLDRVNGSTPLWPTNERVYIYGSLFLDWVTRTYGDSIPSLMVQRVANSWLPPALFFNRIPRAASGHSFTELYDEWLAHLDEHYAAVADSLRAIGITTSERLTDHGYRARYPRFAADGSIAYAAADGRTVTQTRVLAANGAPLLARRRNSIAALSWTPDGGIITSQLEQQDRYRLYSDLYRIDAAGREHRLTNGARLEDPDVSRDGSHIVAIRNEAGATDLQLLRFDGQRAFDPRTIARGDADIQWARPRFAPDGRTIAVSRWSAGGLYQLVLMDTAGTVVREITHDAAIDVGAAFSPDGRWLVFGSDRTGIANLYALDLNTPAAPLLQVTNVLGGAYDPDVAPDGRSIVFVEYDADGFHVARVPFDPGAWRIAPPAQQPLVARPGIDRTTGTIYAARDAAGAADVRGDAMREGAYRGWRTARPYFWAPIAYTETGIGTFLGASSFGADVIGRHQWNGYIAVAPENGRTLGSLGYTWAGLGNPVVHVDAARAWDVLARVRLPSDTTQIREVLEREDALGVRLGVLRPRVRWALSLTAGGELVRRSRLIEDSRGARLRDPVDNLYGIVAGVGLGTTRAQPFSISREDGISVALSGRHRWDRGAAEFDGSYSELIARNSAYRSLDLPGFARHVLALRANGLHRTGPGAEPTSIGGASGDVLDSSLELGGGSQLLPVRGYRRGVRAGTTGWSAGTEYRFPLAIVGRGIDLLPIFVDRVSGALFVDAGDAWCTERSATRYLDCAQRTEPGAPLVGAGAELNLDLGILGYTTVRARLGAAMPLRESDDGVAFYLRFGPAF